MQMSVANTKQILLLLMKEQLDTNDNDEKR